jgi:hypothetical protein
VATLQKEFKFPFGVKRADGTLRLFWCTEKPRPHSMVHWASTGNRDRRTVGRPRTISTNVTESRMKTAVKTNISKSRRMYSMYWDVLGCISDVSDIFWMY